MDDRPLALSLQVQGVGAAAQCPEPDIRRSPACAMGHYVAVLRECPVHRSRCTRCFCLAWVLDCAGHLRLFAVLLDRACHLASRSWLALWSLRSSGACGSARADGARSACRALLTLSTCRSGSALLAFFARNARFACRAFFAGQSFFTGLSFFAFRQEEGGDFDLRRAEWDLTSRWAHMPTADPTGEYRPCLWRLFEFDSDAFFESRVSFFTGGTAVDPSVRGEALDGPAPVCALEHRQDRRVCERRREFSLCRACARDSERACAFRLALAWRFRGARGIAPLHEPCFCSHDRLHCYDCASFILQRTRFFVPFNFTHDSAFTSDGGAEGQERGTGIIEHLHLLMSRIGCIQPSRRFVHSQLVVDDCASARK